MIFYPKTKPNQVATTQVRMTIGRVWVGVL